jgi:hypothetical protein
MLRKKGNISRPYWSKPSSNNSSDARITMWKTPSQVSGVIYSLMNRHSFSIVSFEFFFTKFFMLKPRIDFFSSPYSGRIFPASPLISWFDSRARIRSLMNSSNSGRYLCSNWMRVYRINFFVVWM